MIILSCNVLIKYFKTIDIFRETEDGEGKEREREGERERETSICSTYLCTHWLILVP